MVPTSEAGETAREFASQFARESFEDAAAHLTGDGRENVVNSFPEEFGDEEIDAEDALEQYWWGMYGQYGDFERVGDVTVENDGDGEDAEVTVELVFTVDSETATVRVGDEGVSGLSFSPEYEEPAYADSGAFAERDVTVDAGDIDLDAVLAVPEGDGPFPGILLVHGAGIHDPDGTAGASKILRDFAHGLASDGIASLRYEKRLLDHEVADEDFTLDAVVTDDAVAAVDELASTDKVDSVFVAGHSQGGMAAPRIAEQHGGVAGVVILDGPGKPTPSPEDIDELRYSFEVDGDLDDDQEAALDGIRESVRRIANREYDANETIMGRPGAWHDSVHDCDPVDTASHLGAPAFVAKMGRADKEIQREFFDACREDYERWGDADLPAGSLVELYERVDHYFQDGPTPATMDHLYFGGNVADYVIDDVAGWIHGVADE